MRIPLALITLTVGVVLAVVSYFGLAAPLGTPTDEGFSNPNVQFATTFFVVGVTLIFVSALVYELLPEKWEQ